MDTEEFSILTINIFRHCEKSFTTALDNAHIPHGRMQSFTSTTYGSPIVEVISAPASSMPWKSIAETIKNWLKRKHGREVIISTKGGTVSHAESCSIEEIENLLTHSVDILVLDSLSTKQASRIFKADRPSHKLAS